MGLYLFVPLALIVAALYLAYYPIKGFCSTKEMGPARPSGFRLLLSFTGCLVLVLLAVTSMTGLTELYEKQQTDIRVGRLMVQRASHLADFSALDAVFPGKIRGKSLSCVSPAISQFVETKWRADFKKISCADYPDFCADDETAAFQRVTQTILKDPGLSLSYAARNAVDAISQKVADGFGTYSDQLFPNLAPGAAVSPSAELASLNQAIDSCATASPAVWMDETKPLITAPPILLRTASPSGNTIATAAPLFSKLMRNLTRIGIVWGGALATLLCFFTATRFSWWPAFALKQRVLSRICLLLFVFAPLVAQTAALWLFFFSMNTYSFIPARPSLSAMEFKENVSSVYVYKLLERAMKEDEKALTLCVLGIATAKTYAFNQVDCRKDPYCIPPKPQGGRKEIAAAIRREQNSASPVLKERCQKVREDQITALERD